MALSRSSAKILAHRVRDSSRVDPAFAFVSGITESSTQSTTACSSLLSSRLGIVETFMANETAGPSQYAHSQQAYGEVERSGF
jgi:hypothetical protein